VAAEDAACTHPAPKSHLLISVRRCRAKSFFFDLVPSRTPTSNHAWQWHCSGQLGAAEPFFTRAGCRERTPLRDFEVSILITLLKHENESPAAPRTTTFVSTPEKGMISLGEGKKTREKKEKDPNPSMPLLFET